MTFHAHGRLELMNLVQGNLHEAGKENGLTSYWKRPIPTSKTLLVNSFAHVFTSVKMYVIYIFIFYKILGAIQFLCIFKFPLQLFCWCAFINVTIHGSEQTPSSVNEMCMEQQIMCFKHFWRAVSLRCLHAMIRGIQWHSTDVIMSAMASQITSLMIVCSTVYSGVDQRKHQSSASLAFVRGIHRGPVNSTHIGQ